MGTSPAFTTVVCASLRVQLQNRRPLGLFTAGVAIAALAAVLDVSSLDSSRSRREDVIETAAGLVLLAGYVTLVRTLVRRELGVPAPAG